MRDTQGQRRAEAEQRRTEQRFRLIVETAQEGIWTIDTENRTTYVNRYMAEMLGYTVDEMLGKPLLAFLDEEGRSSAAPEPRAAAPGRLRPSMTSSSSTRTAGPSGP